MSLDRSTLKQVIAALSFAITGQGKYNKDFIVGRTPQSGLPQTGLDAP